MATIVTFGRGRAFDDASIADVLERLGRSVRRHAPVGSRITCDPAPTGTDEDWLLLIAPVATAMMVDDSALGHIATGIDDGTKAALESIGFTQDGSPEFYTGSDEGGFRSWRRGDVNIVTTMDAVFYDRFMAATELARRFNLLDKGDRIALFQAVLYGVDARNLEGRRS